MRTTMMLAASAALTMVAGAADAQAPGAPYPAPGGVYHPPMPPAPRAPLGAPMPNRRWGSQVGGRWWGGANAPGGWAAYRQPYRGYRVPTYWVAPRFYVTDWSRYGLYAPTSGYNWVRYYDDAVLIDQYGGVSDWRGGLDWDGAGYAADGRYDDHRMDRHGPPPPPHGGGHWEWHEGPGAGYPPPPLPPGHPPVGPSHWSDGRTTVTTTTSGGYAGSPPVIVTGGGSYGYGGYVGGVTTVTIQSAPVVTTTTTEVIEDTVTYTRPAVRRVVHRRVWRPRPTCTCAPVRRHRAPAVIGS